MDQFATENSHREEPVATINTDIFSESSEDEDLSPFEPARFLFESLKASMRSEELDRATALQSQTSGLINSKTKELVELMNSVVVRLEELEPVLQRGTATAATITRDLEYTQERIIRLTKYLQGKYPIEYAQAKEKVLSV